jgi:2-polyprenyl-3-methyl-5-hydroxy-6-metoxy-1,4-benzoquinol methylase
MAGDLDGWEVVGCDLCGSQRNATFIAVEAQHSKAQRPVTLVRCLSCGLVYLNPRPNQAKIGEFYSSSYYAHADMERRQKLLRARFRNRFLEGLGGYGRSLDLRMIRKLAPVGLVDVIIPATLRGRLLDVGCGDGERVDWYQARGFEAYGVEISGRAVENARKLGLRVEQGILSDANYPDGFFDVIVMAHVLEHTHSPQAYLQECFRILKPGGVLAVAVPNIESHSASVLQENWSFLMLPIHLYHFSVGTLTEYMRKNGFDIVSLVGKLVYPRMVRSSCRNARQNRPFPAYAKAWLRSGILPTACASLKGGVRKYETITTYCVKQSLAPAVREAPISAFHS